MHLPQIVADYNTAEKSQKKVSARICVRSISEFCEKKMISQNNVRWTIRLFFLLLHGLQLARHKFFDRLAHLIRFLFLNKMTRIFKQNVFATRQLRLPVL
jgi:hypothetical protein